MLKRKEKGDIMSTIKPIQATPELSVEEAARVLKQVNTAPTQKAIKRNNMLRSVLSNIRKT